MAITEFFNLFLLISALHGFAFSIVLFFSKNGKDRSMVYLNLLILAISLNNFQSWVIERKLFQHRFALDYIEVPWIFLAMPFLYMFLVHYLNIEKNTFNILKVAIPMFLFMTLAQIIFVMKNSGLHPQENLDYVYEKYTTTEEIVSFLTSISLFIYSFFILLKKEKLFEKIQSYDNLKWLSTFFKLSSVGYILWMVALIVTVSLNFTDFIFSYYPLRIYTTILIYWLGYQGIRQLRILKERKVIRKGIQKKSKNKITKSKVTYPIKSYAVSETQLEKHRDQFEIIDNYIRKNNKFLESKYTLQNLSFDTDLSSSTLSVIINNVAGKTFTDYLNEMRIEQAKSLLLAPEFSNYTITSIGLESGFNSKSTFYTVFKKHTGITPFEFKNSLLLAN
ncbi:helix-turn-helix domain-containing protein [uncultured Tenacibaculum sp.]|uniref:helix-turn-helix domain-containing protein n=1 Tax=uncultured Tenacibaculum sp. TaxID=174713 RepID=UPI002618ABAD|nr:helix-turn-helix domain-containing protein [uncultured Tenacibaculum sp.]